jgi:hypothetical protein
MLTVLLIMLVTRAAGRRLIDQFGVEEACEITVESFIMADQFVAEAEARHETALFEPEYGTERARLLA